MYSPRTQRVRFGSSFETAQNFQRKKTCPLSTRLIKSLRFHRQVNLKNAPRLESVQNFLRKTQAPHRFVAFFCPVKGLPVFFWGISSTRYRPRKFSPKKEPSDHRNFVHKVQKFLRNVKKKQAGSCFENNLPFPKQALGIELAF